jgi:hypothetical protein
MTTIYRYQPRNLLFSLTLLTLVMLASTQSLRADSLISVAFKSPDNPFGLVPSPNISGPESAATSANSLFGAANVWNNLDFHFGILTTNPAFTNLAASTGAATGVDFSITGAVLPVDLYLFVPTPDPLRSTFIAWNSNSERPGPAESTSISWTLIGLAPNTTFDMFIYGSRTDQNRSFDMTIEGTTLNIPTFGSTSSQPPDGVLFAHIVSDASGTISGTGTGIGSSVGSAHEANWSGFQLVQVPEPSSLVLLGTGLLGLLGTFKKKLSR